LIAQEAVNLEGDARVRALKHIQARETVALAPRYHSIRQTVFQLWRILASVALKP
jgi:hypothetical protein